MRTLSTIAVFVAAASLAASCGNDNPTAPTVGPPQSQAPATFELAGVVRDGATNTPLAGARVEIGGDSRTTGDAGEFTFSNLPAGSIVVKVTRDGYVTSERTLTVSANTNVEWLLAPAAAPPSPPTSTPPSPSPSPSPPPTPPATTFEMTGVVRNRSTGQGIPNARIDVVQGVNLGRTTSTGSGGAYRLDALTGGAMRVRVTANDYTEQSFDVALSGNLTLNFELVAVPVYVYSGIVTDGQGRPVAGARVRGGPDFGYTDASGRYEFRSQYSSVPGNVYPPDGYEPKPWSPTDSFPLVPGQNIAIRRITGVTISPPSTLRIAWGQLAIGAQVSFDTGQVESPHIDPFRITSSDTSVIRAGGVTGAGPYITGLKEGAATVSARYFGVSTASFQVQVVP